MKEDRNELMETVRVLVKSAIYKPSEEGFRFTATMLNGEVKAVFYKMIDTKIPMLSITIDSAINISQIDYLIKKERKLHHNPTAENAGKYKRFMQNFKDLSLDGMTCEVIIF